VSGKRIAVYGQSILLSDEGYERLETNVKSCCRDVANLLCISLVCRHSQHDEAANQVDTQRCRPGIKMTKRTAMIQCT
jgi:hypothetical protein